MRKLRATAMEWSSEPGSFRDPSGFVFFSDGVLYRQVNQSFGPEYRHFVESGLYAELTGAKLLVSHEEVDLRVAEGPDAFVVIRPERIPFISYPYEWCFSQLKAAALLTLDLQGRALRRGLVLRDASAFNVQFIGTRPVFIDTLSFGRYIEGQPWVGYRQFCQHFLAPLALIAYVHPALGLLSRLHLDGIPLDLCTSLLPLRSRLRPGLMMHLHLHRRSSVEGPQQHRSVAAPTRTGAMSKTAMLGLVDSLTRAVRQLTWEPSATLWSTYVDNANYTADAQSHKQQLVTRWLSGINVGARPPMIWDLGANTGVFSRLAAESGPVISFDLDHSAVERHFLSYRNGATRILPLVQDLTNPSSGAGWRTTERRSLEDRGPADVALALALVHHLAITGNVPLQKVAKLFAAICTFLIVEFVPKEDSQVQRMLAAREDVFADYSQAGFEEAFRSEFTIVESTAIAGSVRTLYLMKRIRAG